MENSMKVPQKTKDRITIWSNNPTPGHISGKKKTIIQKDTITPVFIAPLFPIAKTLKQPNCPSIDKLIKKLWYINDWILLSHRKQQNNAICSNMEGTKDYPTKVKSERKRQIPDDITYMWNPKYDTNELIYKIETDSKI